ncbi:MAG TPA: hypothetical protein VFR02_06300 [bacterium]|nr:hypothetical protein [bacterium]
MRKALVGLGLLVLLGQGTAAQAAGNNAMAGPSASMTTTDMALGGGSGLDLKLYSGVDYSFLGDFVNGTKAFAQYLTDSGGEATAWTGNWGWVSGLDLGLSLDPSDRISVGFESVLTRSQNISGTDGSAGVGGSDTPQMFNATLNYGLSIPEGKGTRTFFTVGAGYYHAFLDYNLGVAAQDTYGTFTGDTVGGTLGVGQEWSVGGGFDLSFSAKGRYAVFDKLTATSFNDANNPTPYALAMISIPGEPDILLPQATSNIDANSTMRYAKLDYCGVDATVSMSYHF